MKKKKMQEEKEILITRLDTATFTPKPGQTWQPFTLYKITANDGKCYDTTDKEYYDGLKVGERIKIRFQTITKNKGGRIFTSYKIIRPRTDRISTLETKVDRILALLSSKITLDEDIKEEKDSSSVEDYIDIDEEIGF